MHEKIVAVNTSPRTTWNTAALVREAAKGAEAQGAEIVYFDLYKLEKYQGCVSCFGCKTAPNEGVCICRDGLKPVLDAIREADGLIIGSPNYLGNVTAGFRALYERQVFQSITYQVERRSYNERKIPVLFIMTSNAKEEFYDQIGYTQMIEGYKNNFEVFVGPTKTLISANTVQVSDYSKYNWTMFDPEEKKKRHGTVFQNEKLNAFELGAEMVRG